MPRNRKSAKKNQKKINFTVTGVPPPPPNTAAKTQRKQRKPRQKSKNDMEKKIQALETVAKKSTGSTIPRKYAKRLLQQESSAAQSTAGVAEAGTLTLPVVGVAADPFMSEVINIQTSRRAWIEFCYGQCNDLMPCTDLSPMDFMVYCDWMMLQCFTPNGMFKKQIVSMDYTGANVNYNDIIAANDDLYIPKALIYWIHHFCPWKTKEGQCIRYNIDWPLPATLTTPITGDIVPRTTSSATTGTGPWGRQGTDWNNSVTGNFYYQVYPSPGGNAEWYSALAQPSTRTYESYMKDADIQRLISSYIRETGLGAPIGVLRDWVHPEHGLTAPDASAYAYSQDAALNDGWRFNCIDRNYDPNFSAALGCFNPRGNGFTVSSQRFTYSNPKSALINSAILNKTTSPGLYGDQSISHQHTAMYVYLANTTSIRPGGLRNVLVKHDIYPGIRKTSPNFQLIDLTMAHHIVNSCLARLSETDLNTESPFYDSSRVQQTKVVWELAILTRLVEQCPLAPQIQNYDNVSAYARRTSWKQMPVPEILAHYISLIGNIVIDGEFVQFMPDFRIRQQQFFNGTAPVYVNYSNYTSTPTYISSSPAPGSNIPENTGRWFLDTVFPGIFAKVGGWAPGSFAHAVDTQFAGAPPMYTNLRFNTVIINKSQLIETSDMALVVDTAGVYSSNTRMPLLTPFTLQPAYQLAAQAYSNLTKTFVAPYDLGSGGLHQMSQGIVSFASTTVIAVTTKPPITATNVNYLFLTVPYVQCTGLDYPLEKSDRGVCLSYCFRSYQGIQFQGGDSADDRINASLLYGKYYSRSSTTDPIKQLVQTTITDTSSDTSYIKERDNHYEAAIKMGMNSDAARLGAIISTLGKTFEDVVVDQQADHPATKYARSHMEYQIAYPYYTRGLMRTPTQEGGFNFFSWIRNAASRIAKVATTLIPYVVKGIEIVEFVAPILLKGSPTIRSVSIKRKFLIAHEGCDTEFDKGGWIQGQNGWVHKTRDELELLLGIRAYKEKKEKEKELLLCDGEDFLIKL